MWESNPVSAHQLRTFSAMNSVHASTRAIVMYRSRIRLDGDGDRIMVRKLIRSPANFVIL